MEIYKKNFFQTMPSVVKRSTAAMLCMLVIGLFVAYGCVKPESGGGGNENDDIGIINSNCNLEGTKWVLIEKEICLPVYIPIFIFITHTSDQ